MEERDIDYHLREALNHLETAMNKSVRIMLENEGAKKEIGQKWEKFLAQFYGHVREKSKKSRINLFGWISFSRLRV